MHTEGGWYSRTNHAFDESPDSMADVVNLRTARTGFQRQEAEKDAVKSRLAHGLPKFDRKLSETRRVKPRRDLVSYRTRTGEADEIAGH